MGILLLLNTRDVQKKIINEQKKNDKKANEEKNNEKIIHLRQSYEINDRNNKNSLFLQKKIFNSSFFFFVLFCAFVVVAFYCFGVSKDGRNGCGTASYNERGAAATTTVTENVNWRGSSTIQ